MKTKELARICGVNESTVRKNAKKVGIILENGKSHDYTEDEIKKVQAKLMKNQLEQGSLNSDSAVKTNLGTAAEVGISLQELIKSGNVAAIDEYFDIVRNATVAQHDLQLEQERNHILQLENKQLANENGYLKKANEFTTAQLGYYRNKYHSYFDDYEIY